MSHACFWPRAEDRLAPLGPFQRWFPPPAHPGLHLVAAFCCFRAPLSSSRASAETFEAIRRRATNANAAAHIQKVGEVQPVRDPHSTAANSPAIARRVFLPCPRCPLTGTQAAILAGAVDETLQDQQMQPSPINYFQALMLIMEQHRRADAETHGRFCWVAGPWSALAFLGMSSNSVLKASDTSFAAGHQRRVFILLQP